MTVGISQYPLEVAKYAIYPGDRGIEYLVMGMCSEAGEVAGKLKKIIREELQNIYEGADEDAASKIMSGATKLLNAIESFKESSSEKVKAEIGSNLDG
ncbi:MAG: hypothetical protein EBU66_12360, partial [Bacteroidetes bacterium]|nr:hypothetical protein [Bacteroidota bacterium]